MCPVFVFDFVFLSLSGYRRSTVVASMLPTLACALLFLLLKNVAMKRDGDGIDDDNAAAVAAAAAADDDDEEQDNDDDASFINVASAIIKSQSVAQPRN